jgi:hypothetical protein
MSNYYISNAQDFERFIKEAAADFASRILERPKVKYCFRGSKPERQEVLALVLKEEFINWAQYLSVSYEARTRPPVKSPDAPVEKI